MKTIRIHTLQTAILGLGTASLMLLANPAAGDWQEKLLSNPPDSQLRAEQRGRVMIYEGLKDTRIDRIMDTQFDRLESMMFVRTVITDRDGNALQDTETGDVIVEDDGC